MAVNIATSIDLFAQYRSSNCYYVDKTGFIEELIDQGEAAYLFTRPRRFGKTLFLSMLAEFFDITKDSRELFAGLRVAENEALCREWMNRDPVIFLSLKDVDGANFAEALEMLNLRMMRLFGLHEEILSCDKIWTRNRRAFEDIINMRATEALLEVSLEILTSVLNKYYQKPAIVLIDEYDAPLTKAARQGYATEMADFMRGFLSSALKTNENLMFAVLTGCVRISLADDYGGLNNLKCYGISDPDYAEIFGFTQIEVDRLLQDAGLSGKGDEVRAWYGGYCLGKNQEIYCPWSTMNHVADAQKDPGTRPLPYWVRSGASGFVERFVASQIPEQADDIFVLLAGGCVVRKIGTVFSPQKAWRSSNWSLLYLSGYLTRASEAQMLQSGARPRAARGEMALAIPNQDIRNAFARGYAVWFQSIANMRQLGELDIALWEGDAERLVQLLDILVEKLESRNLACRKKGADAKDTNNEDTGDIEENAPCDNACHAMLTGFLLSWYPDTLSRVIGRGCFDIMVIDGQRALVMVVKRTDNEKEDLAALAKKGLEQIEERRYNVDLADNPDITTVLHWSVAFCRKDCAARAIFVKRP